RAAAGRTGLDRGPGARDPQCAEGRPAGPAAEAGQAGPGFALRRPGGAAAGAGPASAAAAAQGAEGRPLRVSAGAASGGPCRIDVWLGRARFFRSRALAAAFVEAGTVRLARPGQAEVRLDKASRSVRAGDRLLFVLGGRVTELT